MLDLLKTLDNQRRWVNNAMDCLNLCQSAKSVDLFFPPEGGQAVSPALGLR
jgi:hypothetical protein